MVPAANFSGVAGWRWPSFLQMVPRRKTLMSGLGSQRWCDARPGLSPHEWPAGSLASYQRWTRSR